MSSGRRRRNSNPQSDATSGASGEAASSSANNGGRAGEKRQRQPGEDPRGAKRQAVSSWYCPGRADLPSLSKTQQETMHVKFYFRQAVITERLRLQAAWRVARTQGVSEASFIASLSPKEVRDFHRRHRLRWTPEQIDILIQSIGAVLLPRELVYCKAMWSSWRRFYKYKRASFGSANSREHATWDGEVVDYYALLQVSKTAAVCDIKRA